MLGFMIGIGPRWQAVAARLARLLSEAGDTLLLESGGTILMEG